MTNFWTFIFIAAVVLVLGWLAYGIYLLWKKRRGQDKPQANKQPSRAQSQMEDYARKFQQQEQNEPGKQRPQSQQQKTS